MSKQYNKAEKRKRRQAYLKRKKTSGKSKVKSTTMPAGASPAPVASSAAAQTSA